MIIDPCDEIIDDWLSGEIIDPIDYSAYQIEMLKEYLGENREDEDEPAECAEDDPDWDEDDPMWDDGSDWGDSEPWDEDRD